jgi:hypothetical protein
MPAAPRRVLRVATVVFLIALLAPAATLAAGGGNCSASACKVYTESPGSPAGNGQKSSGQQDQSKPVRISSKVGHVLSKAGKDKVTLHRIVSLPGYGAQRGILRSTASGVATPTALGAAFDLGAGPTVLLAILLATALGLGAQGGIRSWRQRRNRA